MEQNWKDILMLRTGGDAWYQQCLQEVRALETEFLEVRALETEFLEVRATLTPEQQDALDRYIAACEELEHALTQLAYRLGQKG